MGKAMQGGGARIRLAGAEGQVKEGTRTDSY